MAWESEPPQIDVDRLLAELQQKVRSLAARQRSLLVIVGLVIVVLGAFNSFYTIQPSEEAVVLRFGRYVGTEPPGLHFKIPFGIDRVYKVKTKVILQEEFGFRSAGTQGGRTSYESSEFREESLTLTGDLNVANVEWIVQYQIADPRKFLFHSRDVRTNLRDASQSVLRRVVGDRAVTEILTVGRAEISEEAQRLTQEVLDRYDIGLRLVTVKLQDVNPPESVRPAFNDVNAAKQEQEQAINNAEREYNKVIPEARGRAEQMIRDAEGYATAVVNRAEGDASRFRAMLQAYQISPTVTRTRLYVEAMEELYGRFKSLTIVDKGVQGLLPIFQNATAAPEVKQP